MVLFTVNVTAAFALMQKKTLNSKINFFISNDFGLKSYNFKSVNYFIR